MASQRGDEVISQDSVSTVCDSPIIAVRNQHAAFINQQPQTAPETQSCSMLALSQIDMGASIFSNFDGDNETPCFVGNDIVARSQPMNEPIETDLDRLKKLNPQSVTAIHKHLSMSDLKSICYTLDAKKAAVLNKTGLSELLYSSTIRHCSVQKLTSYVESLRNSGNAFPHTPSQSLGKRNVADISAPQPAGTALDSCAMVVSSSGSSMTAETPVLLSNSVDQSCWRFADPGHIITCLFNVFLL
jgi:hypothetical protein